jgi:maleylpyruvate isomerase
VVTAQGRHVPVSETLWMRTREVWLHAVDLLTGLRVHDIPDPVKIRLLDDVVGLWSRRGEAVTWRLVESGDAARTWGASPVHGVVQVSGDLSALLAWATGRGTGGRLTWTGAQPQPAPRWL